jgi:hypothetical protein
MNKKEKRQQFGLLAMGVFFGIIGSLMANVLDRQFIIKFGQAYDIGVSLIFIIFAWALMKFADKFFDN